MNFKIVAVFAAIASFSTAVAQTEIVVLGSDHLEQIYKKDKPLSDVYTPQKQSELVSFVKKAAKYKPDMVMVEVLPERQGEIDSLYGLYMNNKLDFAALEDGRSEVYQIAFRIAKEQNLQKVWCVNAPGGTSQGILDNGDNIKLYTDEGLRVRKIVTDKHAALADGSLSLKDYLVFLNKPETYNLVYNLRYILPSRVTNGTFTKPDAAVNKDFINPRYIGAELTSIFKNRDYKIYSNIVGAQMKAQPKRMLLIIGAAHIGSLRSILVDDPAFKFKEAYKILK